jgi:histone-lysine N-methyltransferase SETD3
LEDKVLGPIVSQLWNVEGKEIKATQHEVIALYYLYYKFCYEKDDFFWEPYFRVLPEEYNTILYFTDQEMESLKGSALYEIGKGLRAQVQDQYTFFNENVFQKYPKLFGKCRPTYEQWRWAYSILLARKVELVHTSPQGKKRFFTAIIPYFDFMNHYPFSKCEWGYNADTYTFHAEAHEDVAQGEEVYRSFGEKCNGDLLLELGYILENNPENCVRIEESLITVDENDPLFQEKKERLQKIDKRNLKLFDGAVTQELIEIAQILSATNLQKQANQSSENQAKTYEWLAHLCEKKLQLYPTTLAEDQRFANSTVFQELSEHEKMARTVVLEEKQILTAMKSEFAKKADQKRQEIQRRQQRKQRKESFKDEL